jgi:WD40 repeat protein
MSWLRAGLVAVWLLAPGLTPAAAPPGYRWDTHGDPLPHGAVARLGTVRWHRDSGVRNLTLVPGGKYLASTDGRVLHFWDLKTGRRVRTIRDPDDPHSWAFGLGPVFTADGRWLLSAIPSYQGLGLAFEWFWFDRAIPFLVLWDAVSGREVASLGLTERPELLAIRPDGKQAAFVTRDGTRLSFWPTSSDRPRRLYTSTAHGKITHLAFSRDGNRLTAIVKGLTSRTSRVVQWNTDSERVVDVLVLDPAHHFALSPGGDTVATFTSLDELLLYDLAADRKRRLLPGKGLKPLDTTELTFSLDGRTLLALNRDDKTVEFWDVPKARWLRRLHLPGFPLAATGEQIALGYGDRGSLLLSEDGKTLIMSELSSRIRLWDAVTGRPRMAVDSPVVAPRQLTFSVDGKSLAVWLGNDHQVFRWETRTGKLLGQASMQFPDDVRAWEWSRILAPGGRHVIEIEPQGFALYETSQGTRRRVDETGPKVLAQDAAEGGRDGTNESSASGR